MNDAQLSLARHALGLPSRSRQSYRNRFFAGSLVPALDQLVDLGLAECLEVGLEGSPARYRYSLTLAGAKAALKTGESLDPEDFPA